jgi:glycerophosphoryl diester phosphodiesterase
MRYQIKIYDHRGASQYAPENSMEAFQMAYDMGRME